MTDRTVKVTLIANAAGFVRGMDEARRKTRETSQDAQAQIERQKAAYSELGTTALAFGALAVAGVGLAIAKFAEFDQSMSEVQASTHESASNMGLLRDAAVEAGSSTVFTATESANAINELAKAGVSTADILGGALTGSLDLASAGGLGVAEAASIAATAMTQFNVAGADVPHIADLLAAGAGKAQGSVQDLSSALNQGGLVASQAGFSIEETTGTLAAFASAGLLGSDAGTSLKTAILALQKPSSAAAGVMKEYGISVYDSSGSMLGFSEIAGQLQSKLGGLTEEQRNSALATIFGTDAVRSAGVLYAQGAEGIAEWEAKVNDSGYAAETARIKLDNLNGDVEKLGGAFDSALIKSGSSANDVLRQLVQAATGLVDTIGSLPEPVLGVGLGLAGLVGTVGLLGGGFLNLVPKISATKTAMADLKLTGRGLAIGLGKSGLIGAALASAAAGFAQLGQGVSLSELEVAKLDSTLKTSNLYGLDAQFDTGRRGAEGFSESLKQLYTSDFFQSEQANLGVSRFLKGASGGLLNLAPGLEKADAQFKQLGTTLADVAKNDFARADSQFRQLADAAGGGREQVEQLLNAMPAYKAQLIELASAAGYATDDQSILNIAMQQGGTYSALLRDSAAKNTATLDELGGVAGETGEAISDLAEQIKNFGSVQFDVEEANIKFNQSLNDLAQVYGPGARDALIEQQIALGETAEQAATTADSMIGSLDVTSEAGQRTLQTFLDTASSANDYAAATLAVGGSTTDVQGILDAGRQKIIDTRVALGDSAEAAKAYADRLIATPESIQTAVVLNGVQRSQEEIDAFINANHNRVVSIQVNATNPNVGFGLGDGRANGGAIYGPGGPKDDTAGIFRLSNGEHVLTAADVQAMGGQHSVYKFRASLHGFAEGGAVSPRYRSAPRGGYGSSTTLSVAPQFNVVLSSRGGIDLTQYIDAQIVAANSGEEQVYGAGWRVD